MSSDRIADRLDDILANIDRIRRYIADVDEAQFFDDGLVYDAVERCTERICEAVSQLGRLDIDLEALEPTIPWGDIRGLGNRLRHAYFSIDADRLWTTVKRDLDPLEQAVQRMARRRT
jgi:uncharacterized protein with HEPN domain